LRISLALLCACAAAGLLTWVLLTSAKAEDGEATNIWPTVLGALAQHELEEELIPREFTPGPKMPSSKVIGSFGCWPGSRLKGSRLYCGGVRHWILNLCSLPKMRS
jgi:hypothetical protein